MANKTRNYEISWVWKEMGNRGTHMQWRGKATTVPRAISKMVKELNEGDYDPDFGFPSYIGDEDAVKASDLMVTDCRTDDK